FKSLTKYSPGRQN
nr:RecName: Full=Scolopendra 6940.74 Da toxin [Scolopendra viridicornis nigra]